MDCQLARDSKKVPARMRERNTDSLFPVEMTAMRRVRQPSMCILTGLESRDLRRAQRAAIAMSGTHGDPHINMAPTGTGDRRRASRSEAY